jgi:hypothetical protein
MALHLPSLEEWRLAVQRQAWANDPPLWIRERLKRFIWSKQEEIAYSIRDHRYTAVPSCYGPGKSYIAASLAAYWIDVYPPGKATVITTATTGAQVKSILWHEISLAHAEGKLPGRLNQTEWWREVTLPNGETVEQMVAFGRKPAEHNPTAFQGIHKLYVLVIVDEASGVPKSLIDALQGLMSNEYARMLLIGNPEDPDSEFARVCKAGSGYNVIPISVWDTPNFTGEYVPEELKHLLVSPLWQQERLADWGEDSPMYQSKVHARFPRYSEHALISQGDILAAQKRWADLVEEGIDPLAHGMLTGPIELGVDVGGGGDKNVIAVRAGDVVKVVREDQEPDTMKTLDHVIDAIEEHKATRTKVDNIGIGHGAVDRAKQMARDQELERENPQRRRFAATIEGVTVSDAASDSEHFANLRAEAYWQVRESFRAGDPIIDPSDHKLAAQLGSIQFFRTSTGKIQIESKKDMRERKMPSPDRADAFVLAWWRGTTKKGAGVPLVMRKGRYRV